MKRRKAISIVVFLSCVAASILTPLAVQAYWNQHSKEWAAERRGDAAAGIWVYGLGIDKVLEPLSITDLESAIGGYPTVATEVMVVFPGTPSRASFTPTQLRSGSVAPIHLPPGTEVLISHAFSRSAVVLIGCGIFIAAWSWLVFAILGMIGVLRDAEGWRWRNRLLRISTYAGATYAALCLVAFIALQQ